MGKHQAHPEIVKRLKRASGHLCSVIEMLEKEEDCLNIAQQLQAVTSAVVNAKSILVSQHIEDCLHDIVPHSKKNRISEFKEIAKYI
jgi:DNA-binding FrmR family transcriptional regulator